MSKTSVPVFVIYHRADWDGRFSKLIAERFFGENAQYIGWDYGDPKIPFPETGIVYVIDLSPDCIEAFGNFGPSLLERVVWIDHHRTAIEKFNSSIIGFRLEGVAACRLAWQWFFSETGPMNPNLQEYSYQLPTKEQFVNRAVDEPWAVRLAGEYDIWDHRDDRADIAFQFGLDSQKDLSANTLLSFGQVADDYVNRIVQYGRAAMACYATRDADVMRHRSFKATFEGLNFLVLNTARCNSGTFSELDKPETGHDALMAFYWTGKNWSVSMYHAAHRKDIDLSQIAKKMGGGGHAGACGFITVSLPFIQC